MDGRVPRSLCPMPFNRFVLLHGIFRSLCRWFCPRITSRPAFSKPIVEACEALAELTDDYEVLVVDDGSSDDTAALTSKSQPRCVPKCVCSATKPIAATARPCGVVLRQSRRAYRIHGCRLPIPSRRPRRDAGVVAALPARCWLAARSTRSLAATHSFSRLQSSGAHAARNSGSRL